MQILIIYLFLHFCRVYEKKKKQLDRLKEQLTKLEVQATDREENKEIALSTSKLNYLDPRISVAWQVQLHFSCSYNSHNFQLLTLTF